MEAMEVIAEQAEHADNLIAASRLPIDNAIHVDQLRNGLIDIRNALRDVYINETGDDPWSE